VILVEWVRGEGIGLEKVIWGRGGGFESCKCIAHGSIHIIIPENVSVEKIQMCIVC
jgi:hypothetical protein